MRSKTNKTKYAEAAAAEAPPQRGLSLALKLNSHLLGDLFGLFLLLNVVFAILVALFTYSDVTEKGTPIVEELVAGNYEVAEANAELLGFTLSEPPADIEGIGLPFPWGEIADNGEIKHTSCFFNWHSTDLDSYFTVNETDHRLSYDLGWTLARWWQLALGLFIVEAIFFFVSLITGITTIRRSLKPIAEMERATKLLRETTPKELSRLAGRISTMDADDLDKRLSVIGAQEELRGLAEAINGLLERIDEAYRSQKRFVSDASHELRTPIAVIQGYANLLDRWGKTDEKTLQESIDAIKNEAAGMKDLVEQLLFLARGDNETMAVELSVFDLHVLAEEVWQETRMIDVSHEFVFTGKPGLTIEADRGLMKQAVRILVDNSIKYTPAREKITLRVDGDIQQVYLTVQDNGIGIVPEDLPYIFDRFYRSDESRARKTGGAGLGLSIAKWIAHRHGGHLEVMSRKDFGTRISLVLPKKAPPPPQPPHQA